MNGFMDVCVNEIFDVSGGYNCDGNPSGTNNWTGGASKASDYPPAPIWDFGIDIGYVQIGTDGWQVKVGPFYIKSK